MNYESYFLTLFKICGLAIATTVVISITVITIACIVGLLTHELNDLFQEGTDDAVMPGERWMEGIYDCCIMRVLIPAL